MFTIQYEAINGEHVCENIDTNSRTQLIFRLAQFERPIVAVYEQVTVITKIMREKLAEWPGTKSRAALDFIKSRP